jgi:hypothetical protein
MTENESTAPKESGDHSPAGTPTIEAGGERRSRRMVQTQAFRAIEEEVTKTLNLMAGLYTRLGHTIGEDPELREMLRPLDPESIEREVTEQINDAIPRLHLGAKAKAN